MLGDNFTLCKKKYFGRPKVTKDKSELYQSMYATESKKPMKNIVYLRDTTMLELIGKKIT